MQLRGGQEARAGQFKKRSRKNYNGLAMRASNLVAPLLRERGCNCSAIMLLISLTSMNPSVARTAKTRLCFPPKSSSIGMKRSSFGFSPARNNALRVVGRGARKEKRNASDNTNKEKTSKHERAKIVDCCCRSILFILVRLRQSLFDPIFEHFQIFVNLCERQFEFQAGKFHAFAAFGIKPPTPIFVDVVAAPMLNRNVF